MNDFKQAIRDVLAEQSYYAQMLESVSSKGPAFPDSERVLIGLLLAGDVLERDLLPCRAVDFATPVCRAAFVACCVVQPGPENHRLAQIVLAMEADGVQGARECVDDMLLWREEARGERPGLHIRRVAEAGAARRMARYLDTISQDLRLGRLTALQAEARLAKKLSEEDSCVRNTKPAAVSTITTRTRTSTGR